MGRLLRFETTVFRENVKQIQVGETAFSEDCGVENQAVNLYPSVRGQRFEGFGGAFTDSAGYVYAQMSEEQRKQMLYTYFDKKELNYRLGRIHLDSCDFSMEQYEALSDANDTEMKNFSLERGMKYILPLLQDAERAAGRKIELMLSPWSPPAFMKTNGQRSRGGKLKEEFRGRWARYVCLYIKRLREMGCLISRISLQNEPAAVQTWDSCIYTAEEEKVFLREFLYPEMVKNGLDDIEIYIWDHNKERVFERACGTIDETTDQMITGVAFHWYSGDHFEALDYLKKRFPDKKMILSEACIEYSKYSAGDGLANARKYAHDMIGNLNHGMTAFYDWNLVLDEVGGPNHVGNYCDAPYLYDTKKKELMERNTLAYIRHFSHYIQPGAVWIGSSRYTDEIDVTAFENPDHTIQVVLLNRTEQEKKVFLRLEGEVAELTLPANGIMTAEIFQ
ncbi:MAG: glycoside hydrolase family 30 beta sandwich domain-containing protein [Lachnospiraceae bacterium]|nr:glycoside hydrolase family 30 beta sandwich domain-containing protein [Lachnospiraceae bacterium]